MDEKTIVERLVSWLKRLGYGEEQIQVWPQYEIPRSRRRQENLKLDIAVFKGTRRINEDLLIIAECKKPGKRLGLDQLQGYLKATGARVGIWFDGDDLSFVLRSSAERLPPDSNDPDVMFGEYLRNAREAKFATEGPHFSQRQLAERIGISPAHLNRIEHGKSAPPAIETIEVLAKELGVNPTELCFRARKVPKRVVETILQKPAIMDLMEALAEASDERILWVMKNLDGILASKEVKDGKW